jgi:hypothetical protein
MKEKIQNIEIEIDKLTNSIENVITGDCFKTEVMLISDFDLKGVSSKNKWLFNWNSEYKNPDRDVYKLVISGNESIIQGLISITEKQDHVYVHLIESAPFNMGKNKVYVGVPGNLFAFACKVSFHRGFEGYVSFTAKTQLIGHYIKTLNAAILTGNLMVINNISALKLINKYF